MQWRPFFDPKFYKTHISPMLLAKQCEEPWFSLTHSHMYTETCLQIIWNVRKQTCFDECVD